MKVADFFCGAGGFSEGFRMAGFEIVLAVDKWGPAILTHEKNHINSKTINYDVEALSLLPNKEFEEIVPDTEIIIGSPPCVAFSNSNKSGKGDKSLGITLVESYLRIVARKKFKENSSLKYWILENVPNLQHYIKPSYSASELGITDFGYDPSLELYVVNDSSGIYNAKHYGVAQNRKRFFCGSFPKPEETVRTDKEIIPLKDILDSLGSPLSGQQKNSFIKDPNYPSFKLQKWDLTDHFYIQEIAKFQWEKAKKAKTDKGYMGKMAFPENLDNPSRTVMATMSSSSREAIIYSIEGKKDKFRTPTIREIASIMSFPLDYNFYGESILTKYRLVGNAVPPKLSFAFAKEIAIKENLDVPKQYITDVNRRVDEDIFINLNHTHFPIKEEVRKDISKARYKYHIPYLIMDAYRVELTNYNSDFKNKNFNWEVEIHKGQGPTKKLYYPSDLLIEIEDSVNESINIFIQNNTKFQISSFQLQENYCLTVNERKEHDVYGPDEILDLVRDFIDSLNGNINFVENRVTLNGTSIPLLIGLGVTILMRILDLIKEKDNNKMVLNK